MFYFVKHQNSRLLKIRCAKSGSNRWGSKAELSNCLIVPKRTLSVGALGASLGLSCDAPCAKVCEILGYENAVEACRYVALALAQFVGHNTMPQKLSCAKMYLIHWGSKVEPKNSIVPNRVQTCIVPLNLLVIGGVYDD